MQILHGDVRETLKEVEAGTVHCCVTSPPYWGLRAYIDDLREIGREKTPEEHLANIADVFREVRRVLRDDGVMFLNYGDAYATGNCGGSSVFASGRTDGRPGDGGKERLEETREYMSRKGNVIAQGYKPKDLLSMPFRVVEALRNDGWYHRSTIVWSKKSPMPESVRGTRFERCRATSDDCPGCSKCSDNGGYVLRMNAGRPTTSMEYVFLLTKSPMYFYNLDGNRVPGPGLSRAGDNRGNGKVFDGQRLAETGIQTEYTPNPAGRNLWTVWDDIKQSNYKAAHFATMPLDLALRCVKLGTSDYGCCPTCGAQWAPVVETDRQPTRPATANKRATESGEKQGNVDPERHETQTNITEWRATCQCEHNEGGRPVVCDPFHGSGTTGEAARECGCDYIGCELNEEYIELGSKRFEQATFL